MLLLKFPDIHEIFCLWNLDPNFFPSKIKKISNRKNNFQNDSLCKQSAK